MGELYLAIFINFFIIYGFISLLNRIRSCMSLSKKKKLLIIFQRMLDTVFEIKFLVKQIIFLYDCPLISGRVQLSVRIFR